MARGYVVAKETINITVGARPPVPHRIKVRDRRSGELVEMDADWNDDEGDLGIGYTFKQFQKVPANHEAVKANPSAFMAATEVDEALIVTA